MDYSKAAYSLFPRYRLDEAIEHEVEKMTGQEFHSLEEARRLLLEAGNRASSLCCKNFSESPRHLSQSVMNGEPSTPTSVALIVSSLLKPIPSLIGAFWENPRAKSYGRG